MISFPHIWEVIAQTYIQKNAHNILEKLSIKNQFKFHWVWIWGEKLCFHLLTTNAVGFIFEWRQYELKLNVKYNLTLKHEVAECVRGKTSSSSEWLIAIYKIITYKKISHFQLWGLNLLCWNNSNKIELRSLFSYPCHMKTHNAK